VTVIHLIASAQSRVATLHLTNVLLLGVDLSGRACEFITTRNAFTKNTNFHRSDVISLGGQASHHVFCGAMVSVAVPSSFKVVSNVKNLATSLGTAYLTLQFLQALLRKDWVVRFPCRLRRGPVARMMSRTHVEFPNGSFWNRTRQPHSTSNTLNSQ
jgi:hypothetical protein